MFLGSCFFIIPALTFGFWLLQLTTGHCTIVVSCVKQKLNYLKLAKILKEVYFYIVRL